MKKLILPLLLFTLSFGLGAQMNPFTSTQLTADQLASTVIQASKKAHYSVDLLGLKAYLSAVPYREDQDIRRSSFEITLPQPDGTMHSFRVLRNKTMHPDLSAQFPDILTFDGYGITDASQIVKLDITPQGFHAMIRSAKHSTIFIDPISQQFPHIAMVYHKKDFFTDKIMDCQVHSLNTKEGNDVPLKIYGTCQLRTYRLALAATAEYTSFHGGTVALAQAAQVTTMNRVNGVYETDMAITMVLVSNNQNIIYTNSLTDPYTNGQPNSMISENVSTCNSVIGAANYDIGHVFGTNSGGLAGLAVVCSSNKARGVTGSGAPVGDPFDIDYVAHEMGHQFAGNHTQNNNCNRNGATAVEPGC